MAKADFNVISAFLLIAVIIGASIVLGNKVMTGDTKEIYADFYSLDTISVSNMDVIENSDEYNSLQLTSGFNTANESYEYRISFGDNLNFSDVNEYTIEMSVNYSDLVEGDYVNIMTSFDNLIDTTYNGSLIDMYNNEVGVVDVLRNAGDGANVQLSDYMLGRFESDSDIMISYKINTENRYIIKTVESKTANLKQVAFSTFDDLAEEFNVLNNGELVISFADILAETMQNNLVSENASVTIDYIKLKYEEPVAQE